MSDLRLRARSVTEIVDAAFQLYRRDALEYILVTAVVYAPILIAQLMLLSTARVGDPAMIFGAFGPLWYVLSLVGVVGVALMTAVVIKLSSDVYLGRSPDLAAVIRSVLPKILPLFGALLLFMLLMMVGFIPFIAGITTGNIGLGLAGFCIGFVWYLYVIARFFAVWHVIVLEDRGVIAAFVRASALSRGQKGHILLTLFLIFIIMMVLAFAVVTVAALTSSPIAAGVIQMLYALVTYPLMAIALMILYYDTRIRAEGFDIEVMTGALGSVPPSGASS